MIKPFDKDLYDKSDPPAKKAMIEWLSLNGYVNIDDKETKSFDLVCNKVDHDISTIEPRKYFYEVERIEKATSGMVKLDLILL